MATFQYATSTGGMKSFDAMDANAALGMLPTFKDVAAGSGVQEVKSPIPAAPVAPPGTVPGNPMGTPAAPTGPITSSQLENASALPDPTSLVSAATAGASLSTKVASVAGSALDASRKTLDDLLAQKQTLEAAQKAQEEQNVKNLEAGITKQTTGTPAADALAAARTKFDVDNKIKLYSEIATKIVGAQEALNMGLIYEQDRPAREQLLVGRSASLQKQGLATIGALQGVAAVLKGDIDLAQSYADATISAIKEDDQRQMTALTTLLQLHNDKLVELTKEEKATLDERLANIQSQFTKNDADKKDIQDLMVNYPEAFLKGGVTLLDSKDSALKKMLPKMAAMEMQKFNADLAVKLHQASTAGKVTDAPANKSLLLAAKAKGMTYHEAILAFGDSLSISYIDSVYPGENKSTTPDLEKTFANLAYQKYLDDQGNLKPGVTVTIDPKNGRPVVSQEPVQDPNAGGVWNWFTNQGKYAKK